MNFSIFAYMNDSKAAKEFSRNQNILRRIFYCELCNQILPEVEFKKIHLYSYE